MENKLRLFLSVLMIASLSIACGSEEAANGGGNGDADTAETAASGALTATGTAYLASVDDAEAAVGALIQALSISPDLPAPKDVSFDGDESGSSGTVSWSGNIGETDDLNLDYTLTFSDYMASSGGVTLDGSFSISVSEGSSNCTGAWNIADLDVTSGSNQVTLDSTGSGITLSGANCESMSLDGGLDVSGSVSADCDVSGSVTSPSVDCS